MSLQVTVINATNVPNVETLGQSDPYTIIEYQGIRKKTEVIKSELNPTWNQTFDFDLRGQPLVSADEITIYVKDWERVGRNRLLGTAKVPLRDLLTSNSRSLQLSVSLLDGNGRPTTAKLNIKLHYKLPASSRSRDESTSAFDVTDLNDEEDEEDEEDYDETNALLDEVDGGSSSVKTRKKKHKRKKKLGTRKIRKNLSTKPQDFQIRVKIVEARQLPGSNISPIVRVSCYKQAKQTRVQKSTNSPFWSEVFFFNFFCSPSELFDELITFGVYNSRQLRSDSFIGSFKCDIGMIHEETGHSLINKWLLLSDPDDTQSGAKGYLKICITILGPGDEAPSFKSAIQDDEEDIESNLLKPAGIQLRPATFKLKIYRAEDIPRMDSDFIQGVKKVFGSDDKKELVDPYFVFSFTGKEIRSKIMYNNDHPEWNQALSLGLQFPSMCERIKLQIFDWDRVYNDDGICTSFLNTRTLSRNGDFGFLPTFGPCFVNFYGSPREYSDLPDEHEDLNLGKGEGVSYRGRVLLELQSCVGELPEVGVVDLANEEVYKVQKYCRRRKYKLHAAFMNASMISVMDAPIEFEVSIGNYGNKLDDSIAPCSSTTQPTNAVFDGCFYYFLPWGDTKPCISVDSHWEDISFRLETMNFIGYIISDLEEDIEQVRLCKKANSDAQVIAQTLISLFDRLINNCRHPLPPAIDAQHIENSLDRSMRVYRESELNMIRGSAKKLRQTATDADTALNEVEGFLAQLHNIVVEPQNSMPDVIIWMICGDKRVAYHREPANHLIYSSNPRYRGKSCGKLHTVQLKYPGNKIEKDNKWEIPGLLRLKIWLGLEKQEAEWRKMQTDGDLAVFAETYENQVTILGNWTNKGPTMSRPKYSDGSGNMELAMDHFIPPLGWKWDSEWYISPELSMLFDLDAGHKNFLENVYECRSRYPGGQWGPASVAWTDVKGDALTARDEIELPGGWVWDDEWLIDLNRAVDEDGWEYTVEMTMGGFTPVQKTYHLCCRRRWVRPRTKVPDAVDQLVKEKVDIDIAEGWEYAPLFNMKFHHKERGMDLVRRRRWHRKMIAEVGMSEPCFFNLKQGDDQDKEVSLAAPRMFLTCKKAYKYQLRVYIYQARDLLAGDSNGLSDPYARVIFLNKSDSTERLDKTLCPTWDQTLMFDTIEIHGPPKLITAKPPTVMVEIFDHDSFGDADYLGRTEFRPFVRVDQKQNSEDKASLKWHTIYKGTQQAGELLASAELFLLPTNNILEEDSWIRHFSPVLNENELPFEPPKRGNLFTVPSGIRPVLQKTAIEVMCWGVRNMKKFQLGSVSSPNVELEVGGIIQQTQTIKNTSKNPNFSDPILFLEIMLPKEELYMPPLNIWVRDNRQFGRKPVVGVHVVKSLQPFRCDPYARQNRLSIEDVTLEEAESSLAKKSGVHIIEMPTEKMTMAKDEAKKFLKKLKIPLFSSGGGGGGGGLFDSDDDKQVTAVDDIDWWSKYYASTGDLDKCKQYLEHGYDKIQIYKNELEKVEKNDGFNDFCHTFELSRGKACDDEESNIVGEFKGSFRVYPLPEDPALPSPPRQFSILPISDPQECLIRIYVIRAYELQPNDPSGLADPYVSIRLGKKSVDNKDCYLPNTLNPTFATMFEIKTLLPIDKDLYIRVKDYDLLGSDDIIGETVIDLENRLLSSHRATVGLPQTYCISGPCEWRDSQKPRNILDTFCQQMSLPAPVMSGNTAIIIGNCEYNISEFENEFKPTHSHLGPPDQRLALHVLHVLPKRINARPLMREHIETRPLYNPLQPGIEQGKLEMWVDVYPVSLGAPPPPIDIKARRPKSYQLRIIIWNTKDVILEEESITGEKMSDIYVKGWIAGIDEQQETDVHYRSLDGEGNFNWRFTFPFDYLPAEECLAVKKKEHFWSLDETELHLPPILMVQVWDNDKFSADDFLGTLELNLSHMPKPSKKSKTCTLDQLPDLSRGPSALSSVIDTSSIKTISLFEQKRIRGFWPCYNDVDNKRELTGKVEMELELLTMEEAEQKPAGQGRNDPNQHPLLEEPKRPATSFLWFTSPLKTLKYIIWKNYKWYFIIGIIGILLVLFLVLFFYSVPGAAVDRLFSPN